jgi:hypothetical protein
MPSNLSHSVTPMFSIGAVDINLFTPSVSACRRRGPRPRRSRWAKVERRERGSMQDQSRERTFRWPTVSVPIESLSMRASRTRKCPIAIAPTAIAPIAPAPKANARTASARMAVLPVLTTPVAFFVRIIGPFRLRPCALSLLSLAQDGSGKSFVHSMCRPYLQGCGDKLRVLVCIDIEHLAPTHANDMNAVVVIA